MKKLLERLKFDKKGLIPVIIQDVDTNEVLMLAYMNEEAFIMTMETGKTHFWSRSREKLWLKGEESGNYQQVEDIYFDCDADTLLIKAHQVRGACHKGYWSCFYRQMKKNGEVKIIGKKVFEPKKVYGPKETIEKTYEALGKKEKK
ncbi:MAG TPA: phosphoribosyl-AMP cyclohydrolase [bacterium]|nr:phosphoribosyl-AMP cyclohydrolase [bacterium]